MEGNSVMKIGILGTGDVGKALGNGFIKYGYKVKMGSRDPNNIKMKEWVEKAGTMASGGTFAEASEFGDIIILATLWAGTDNVIKLADPQNLVRKVVIDATNPLDFSKGMPPSLALGHTDSGGEQVQRWLPNSYVVKAFNIVGNANMVNPDFECGPPDMFICGNDITAKNTVTEILKQFGWNVIDIGGIDGSRLLEPLCILWVIYGLKTNSWNHAFKLLKK